MNNNTDNRIRFSHFRSYDGDHILSRGGATAAYREGIDQDGGIVTMMAVRFCHPNDNYNKAQARDKARGLLDKLAYHNGTLKETTHVGYDRYYYRAGPLGNNIPALLEAVEQQTGYRRG